MILYVESNFVLELALRQSGLADCEYLVDAARNAQVEIVVPAYCLVEPYETLTRRHKERQRLGSSLAAELQQLTRTLSYQQERAATIAVTELLVLSASEERDRLSDTVGNLLKVARVVDLSASVIALGKLTELTHGLSSQDSLVYASIISDLQSRDAGDCCFVTTNVHDFGDPDIQADFAKYKCKVLYKFGAARSYVLLRPVP